MVELRKRKAPAEPAPPPPAKKKSNRVQVAPAKPKSAVSSKKSTSVTNGQPPKSGKIAVGDTITLEGFGREVETNDGESTTLNKLVEESKSGVVIFTYPKASTPGCEYDHFSPACFISCV
jgi:peroxiredoxin Q/BCP